MQVETAYKFKLEPTDVQRELLLRMAGCGRVVYNDSLKLTLNLMKPLMKRLGRCGNP